MSIHNTLLLSNFAFSLFQSSNQPIGFGIFRKQKGNLLSPKARSLSDFSNSRIDFGVFRKRNGCLLSGFTLSLSNFSNSRDRYKYPYVAKAMQNLPIFAQVDRYKGFLT